MITDEVSINGTLIWYYYICKREVWLMSRYIVPDQENANIDLGRFIHDEAYERQKKEINLGNIVLDIYKKEKGQLIIGEVKKTSRYEKSAMMQLAFYLKELKEHGVNARGELLFPKERKKVKVELTDTIIEELKQAENKILQIIYSKKPLPVQKTTYCKNCGYCEFCWS